MIRVCPFALSIRTQDEDGGFYERAFSRLEEQGTSKEKLDAEVELLKAQALLCKKDSMVKDHAAKGAEIANKGAQIANIKSIMETGVLTKEQMVECRTRLFILGIE